MVDTAVSASCANGIVIVRMASGVELRFLIHENKRLVHGTEEQLNNIEISPYDLHWPDLDEGLSFKGLLAKDYGQYAKNGTGRCRRLAAA